MRSILIILVLFCIAMGTDLKERLDKLQNHNVQLLTNQKMDTIPMQSAADAPAPAPMRRSLARGLTRVEVKQEYMDDDIKLLKTQMTETKELLNKMVTTMEIQTKLAENTTNKSGRNELILEIVLGILGFFITGGTGYFGWKNKHLVFNRFKSKDATDE